MPHATTPRRKLRVDAALSIDEIATALLGLAQRASRYSTLTRSQ